VSHWSTLWIALVLLLGLIALAIAAYKYWTKPRESRIRFLDPKKAVIVARGERRCSACKRPLAEDEPRIRCAVNAEHVFHKRCKALLRGKCFECRGALEP
jgi:hypothetical protein